MSKVILVDDEKLIRQELLVMVDWKSHSFEVIGEASNGREALLLYTDLRPDLMVINICLPDINGFQLIEEIRKLDSDCQFIIVSGYADFSYAKTAMLKLMRHIEDREQGVVFIHDSTVGVVLRETRLNNFDATGLYCEFLKTLAFENVQFIAVVGEAVESTVDIGKSYYEAVNLLKNEFLYRGETRILTSDIFKQPNFQTCTSAL